MADYTAIMERAVIGVFAILIFASIIGALQPSLQSILGNASANPNGTLVLGLLALIVVALAIRVLLDVFNRQPDNSGIQ